MVCLFITKTYVWKLTERPSLNFLFRAKSASTADGLAVTRKQLYTDRAGERRDKPNLLILITDSNADVDEAKTITSAEKLKGILTSYNTKYKHALYRTYR